MFEDVDHQKSPISAGKAKADTPIDRLPPSDVVPAGKKQAKLDGPAMVALHQRLMSFYQTELLRQADNRTLMARDEAYYDNEQWSPEDIAVLERRGQAPLVYNVISSTINWVLGSEKRGRVDFKVLPRRKDSSKPAERKSQLLKYLSDVNRSPFHISRSFEDAVKAGIGWVECGAQDDDDGEPVYDRYESWRNILWDSTCIEKDLSDCRYVMRVKWVDLDVALSMFPDRKGALENAAIDGLTTYGTDFLDGDEAMDTLEESMHASSGLNANLTSGYTRRRVRLIECWFRKPKEVKRLRRGDFSGEVYDETSPAHQEAVETGQSVLVDKVMMRVHVAIMTTGAMLYVSESPYRHNAFPLTPIWGNRRASDGLPYGMIRGMVGLQDDINKRASKALHILSTNKVIMDEGAVEDIDAFEEEISRPDAIIVKKPGKEMNLQVDRDLAPAHLELMSRSIMMIQTQSGVTDELMGRNTNAKSGIAIQARQEQGSMATAGLFDNLRFARQVHGEKELSLVEQYFTEEKQFRITNLRGTPEYITINDGLPENDIARTKADFIISEQDWRASVRQAQTEELMQLLMQLAPAAPQVAMVMLDLIVEGMDVPSREELVRRIREITGMRDPDAEEKTPEEQAREQEQAEQAAMQKAMMQAQIAEKQASAEQKAAQAAKSQVDAKAVLASMAGTNVQTQKAALETALAMLMSPPAMPVADGVLHEAGFVSQTDDKTQQAQQLVRQQAAETAAQQAQVAQQEQAMQQEQQMQQAGQPVPGQEMMP